MRTWGTHADGPLLARARVLAPLYAVLAVVLAWPLAAHPTDSLTLGTEGPPTVGLFNLWTLRWNQDRAGHLFSGYWDAPLFHPTTGTFAFSEPQPLTGLVFTPISWLSGNPVLAANLVALAILAANGWSAARLARRLGAAPGPAVLAGVLAQAMPFVAGQLGVLQLTVVFPLFLLVDAIVRWAGGGGRRAAVEIGLWLAVTFLTCGYYGLFAVVGIGVPALLLARRSWLDRDRLAGGALAVAVFAVLALPILLAQARITADHPRPDDLVQGLSATGADFWQLDGRAHGAGVLPWVRELSEGQPLYPGTALLVLGVGGFVVAYRRLPPDDPPEPAPEDGAPDPSPGAGTDRRRVLLFLAVGAGLARVLAMGLNVDIAGLGGPYDLVRAVVPGYESLRSPFRFAVLTEVFLVALAALGLDALWRWRGRWGPGLAVAIVAAGAVETGLVPVRLFEVDRDVPEWATWIGDHPPEDGEPAAVAFLPFPPTNAVASYQATTEGMLSVLDAGSTTVNGYSGMFPSSYDQLEIAARLYPSDEADDLFREHGVRYVVAEDGWLAADGFRERWLAERYERVVEGDGATLYVTR